jgi:hypothetical protein
MSGITVVAVAPASILNPAFNVGGWHIWQRVNGDETIIKQFSNLFGGVILKPRFKITPSNILPSKDSHGIAGIHDTSGRG